MRRIGTSSLGAAATIAFALLLQGCATATSHATKLRVAAQKCHAGEILICDTRSSGRISDGRYGRYGAGGGRRNNCFCQPEQDLDSLIGPDLPSEPH